MVKRWRETSKELDRSIFEGERYERNMRGIAFVALVLFAGIREQLELSDTPKALKGTPIALLTAGLLAMAFMGFSGVV